MGKDNAKALRDSAKRIKADRAEADRKEQHHINEEKRIREVNRLAKIERAKRQKDTRYR